MDQAELIPVIRTTLLRRGDGSRTPIRSITQFWSTDGDLLAEVDPTPDQRLHEWARDADAVTLAVRIAWGLTRNAEFHPTPDGIWARISVDLDGHPYSVTGKGADENEARCSLRDAIVDLFDDRKRGATP